MRIETQLVGLVVFLLFSGIVTASDLSSKKKSLAYDKAVVLGQCAGLFNFMSSLFEAQGNPYQAKDASQKSNGWRIASMGALYTAGWKGERIAITMNSIYEGALTQWLAKSEGNSEAIGEEI